MDAEKETHSLIRYAEQGVRDLLREFPEIRKKLIDPCEGFAHAMSPMRVDPWDEPCRQTQRVVAAAKRHRDEMRESGEWPREILPFCHKLTRALWSLGRMWMAAGLYSLHIQRVFDLHEDCRILAAYCS